MSKNGAYCLIVEGNYSDASEAAQALRDSFIEEWIEETGNFKIDNFDEILVAQGISLGDLKIEMIGDETFRITCSGSRQLNWYTAKQLAETLKQQGMLDEIKVEPL
jgi:hypothetical protein